MTTEEFAHFRKLIYRLAGISLSESKLQMVQARLRKRLYHFKLNNFGAYYDLLTSQGENGPEIGAFINCITTNKTDFYREPHHFSFVKDRVIPEREAEAHRTGEARSLRVWHAGCSTGEEPYTLGMSLAEALRNRSGWDWRQLASDIDTNVLEHAERGVYEVDRLSPIPKELRPRYFLRGVGEREGSYKVRNELKNRITFRQINLLAPQWPIRPDVRFDLIFCRNVVIYFDKPTQRTLIARFERYLRPGGYLFLGHSESLLGISNAFESLGNTIYRYPDAACTCSEGV